MAFLRFVVGARHPSSGVTDGLFRTAYELEESATLSPWDASELSELLDWFREHLPVPDSFSRSSSKGAWRRNHKGIAWVRDSATEHIARLRCLAALLERNGTPTCVLVEQRVGYVVYEDDDHVIAEPFGETRT